MKHLHLKDLTGSIDSELFERGRPGRGVVTAIELERSVRVRSDEHRVCRVSLRIEIDGERAYPIIVRQRFPEALVPVLTGSATVPVRVDPADPTMVAIDLAAMR